MKKSELKELLYLKLLSFASSHVAVNLDELIRNFSPEIRLSVFTQIIDVNILETKKMYI